VGVKSSNDVLQRAIGIGDAFMLAQMLEPGIDEQRFPPSALLRRYPRTRPMHTRRRAVARNPVLQARRGTVRDPIMIRPMTFCVAILSLTIATSGASAQNSVSFCGEPYG
jgi:hypothetical protein